MAQISIENMEFFAYHGCFEEEQIIGNHFLVDVLFWTDTIQSEQSDKLSDTINYQHVYQLVKQQMEIKSQLLEHVANRIANSIKKEFPQIEKLSIKVSKLNPPIGGKIDRVSLKIDR